jgi:hypothetical protein
MHASNALRRMFASVGACLACRVILLKVFRGLPVLKLHFGNLDSFVTADTPEEAAQLIELLILKSKNVRTTLPVMGKSTLSENEAFAEFWAGINSNAIMFLTYLLKYPNGVKGDHFSDEINLPVEKFGGVLGGASKIAKKHNLRFAKIVQSEMRVEGAQRYRWLCPGPLLLKYGKELKTDIVRMPSKISVGA